MNRTIFSILVLLTGFFTQAQSQSNLSREQWVDSVFRSLSPDEKIAQLMVVRAHSNLGPDHVEKLTADIRNYNIGGLCFFQGGPVRQAMLTNRYQAVAKTPLMITIDAEWGLGMRLDSVAKFPYQLTLGALEDENLVYRMGLAVGLQCKRIGVHVNYAPVVDINNNPNNPVIGYRSFGEDRDKVARFGVAYMKGMQDAGIMACAKHFPGHGDVDVDSHYDLPVINKTQAQLDSMELVPFRALFNAGVGSVMIAHLYIPSIDATANKATSLSWNNVTGLLREKLQYQGLAFTDALEMKGVAKFFPGGTISVEALAAGNDMLCLPASVAETIAAVKKAIEENRLRWEAIDASVRRVLLAKYDLGLSRLSPVNLNNLVDDLNAGTDAIRQEAAARSIVLLSQGGMKASRTDYAEVPIARGKKVAYIGLGSTTLNAFGQRLQETYGADVFLFSYKDNAAKADSILQAVPKDRKYDAIIIGVHNYSLRPADNFGISAEALRLYRELNFIKTITVTFGNVLANRNFCYAYTLLGCHQDDLITQQAAADILEGKRNAAGRLPVRVCQYPVGHGIVKARQDPSWHATGRLAAVDSIVTDAMAASVFPGCVVLAVHEGEIVYHHAFGNTMYGTDEPVRLESIFDLASVTKISATTVAVMKLYEQGRLDLNKTLGDYLPAVRGTNKARLRIDEILLHQAGLVPFIAFYKETIDAKGVPDPALYSDRPRPGFTSRVAEGLYLRDDWPDTMFARILASPLASSGKYVYSDNDFIFLGRIVEAITGKTLDAYVQQTFYRPMGMFTTGFKPRERFPVSYTVPTETEKHFRRQTTRGDVHDEGASMFGGVAGHAGLFSNAYDLAMLYQMLINGGVWNGTRYLKQETISLFTGYQSRISRRGYGFDKPEKDNATRKEPYPASRVSPDTFGHTGFTGTCVWADPQNNIIFVFLSNRVYPTRDNNKLGQLQIRGKVQDAIYRALGI